MICYTLNRYVLVPSAESGASAGYWDNIGYILGLDRNNEKENGNYRDYRGYAGIIGNFIEVI